jgi:flagellar hook-length control protein FliK
MGQMPTDGKGAGTEGRTPLAEFGAGLQKFVLKGTNKVKIRLDPPNLGAVDVDIEVVDGDVFLSLQAESASAASELQSQLELLRESLEEQGLNLKEFELGHGAKDAEESKDGKESRKSKSRTEKNGDGTASGENQSGNGIGADGRLDVVV